MRKLRKYMLRLSLLLLLLLLPGCERRELTYFTESEITIVADWNCSCLPDEESGYGATAIFYPEGGGDPKVVLMGNRAQEKVRLTEGRYSVLIFNRSFNDFSGVAFRGTEHLGTHEAYAKQTELRGEFAGNFDGDGSSADSGEIIDSRVVVESPEWLAADVVEGFEVTEDMLGNYSETNMDKRKTPAGDTVDDPERYTVRFTPEPLMTDIEVRMNVKGLNNIRTAVCTLDGMPESVYLSQGRNATARVAQQFALENPVFDAGSPFDGSMSAGFGSFGFDMGIAHSVHLKALLVDGKTVFEQTFNNVEVHRTTGDNGIITIRLEMTTDRIPDVKPEGGADSGFDATVDEWGDEEESEITM